MKALPPTVPRHEPCAPAEQSNALFFIITPRLSHFMPLFPLSPSLENLSITLHPSHSQLPRTSYNADSSKCVFPPARLMFPWTLKALHHYLSIIFPIVYYKGLLMILRKYRGMKEKGEKKEADLGIMGR